jgi:4-hydroxybenzoate polyprenyltransferase
MNILGIDCLLMAGYIINGFYDFEKDMINHPKQTIFGRVVSKSFCFNSYIFLLFLGLGLSSFSGWKVFLFNTLFSFGLWFYSHKLRKKPLTGELGATLLTVSPFASISIYYMTTNLTIILFVGYIAALTLTREVVKRMVSLKGDLIVGEKSIPIIFGIRNCKYIILSFMIASMIMIIVLFPKILAQDISYYFGASFTMIFISTFILRASKIPTQFNRINNIYKGLIVLAIGSIFWY